jgi:hypothetical protein
MSAISGLTGSVTFASGYTILCDSWASAISAALQDETGLSPAGQHQQLMTAGLLQGGRGSYHCKLPVDAVAGSALSSYNINPEEWVFFSACEARETTILGASWRTYLSGLVASGFIATQYIDATTPLIVAGGAGSATLTVTTGVNWTVPYVVSAVGGGVSADDTERRVVIHGAVSSSGTANGGLPLVGTTGAAAFVASAGRQWSGTIMVTGITARVNRRMSQGDMNIEFVWNGTVTPA